MILEAALATVGALAATYVWERHIRDRVRIHRITSEDHKYVDDLIFLYNSLFPEEGENYDSEELLEFVTPQWEDHHLPVEHIVLVASYRGYVVGFVLCHFYPTRRKAIISYYGIDKTVSEARNCAAAALLAKLKRILVNSHHRCDYLFFDTKASEPGLPSAEAAERKARPVVFRQSAKRLGMKAVVLDFPYKSPRVHLDGEAKSDPYVLMCVPIEAELPQLLSKELTTSFLKFVYLDCYGDIYQKSDPRFPQYQSRLRALLAEVEGEIPEALIIRL